MDLAERNGSPSTRHPWEVARAAVFLRLLDRPRLLEGAGDWLDAGAGDAWFALQLRDRLSRAATITCWDVNYTAEELQTLRERGVEGVTYTAERPAGRFDRILMLDLLEHIEGDAAFVVATVTDLLRDDGFLLVSVPAYQALWSSHDRAFGHKRRYSPASCRRLLEDSGLDVVSSGGLFASLLPARIGERVVERLRRPSVTATSGVGAWSGGRGLTAVLTQALVVDGRLSLALSARGMSVPGLSFWALCRPSRA